MTNLGRSLTSSRLSFKTVVIKTKRHIGLGDYIVYTSVRQSIVVQMYTWVVHNHSYELHILYMNHIEPLLLHYCHLNYDKKKLNYRNSISELHKRVCWTIKEFFWTTQHICLNCYSLSFELRKYLFELLKYFFELPKKIFELP